MTKNKITILSNPVNDRLGVSITVDQSSLGFVIISDASGKITYKEKQKLNAGNNVIEVGISNYATGIYYLVFVDDNGRKEVTKFIKK